MPCGGIYPITKKHPFYKFHNEKDSNHNCFVCRKVIDKVDLMFCDEWDCYLHRKCVMEFLNTEEGSIVITHGHAVILYFEET